MGKIEYFEYYQVINSVLFNSPIQAMKELGAMNIGGIQEVMLIDLK